jgi:hypothetical protein
MWSILRPFDIFYGHLVYCMVIWYIFPRFGILYQKNLANQLLTGIVRAIQGKKRDFNGHCDKGVT